jgi:hypothetical protein
MEFSNLWLNLIVFGLKDLGIWKCEACYPILEQILWSVFNYGLGYPKGMEKYSSIMKVVDIDLKVLKMFLVVIISFMD